MNKEIIKSVQEIIPGMLCMDPDFLMEEEKQAVITTVNGKITLVVKPSELEKVATFLKLHESCRYESVIDVVGVDYPENEKRFEVIYELLSYKWNSRLCMRVIVDEFTAVPSLVNIFPGINWQEREVWDMYGIYFVNHPDLRRILTDYGFQGHPFRKDFPLTGYTEVRYDERSKRVITEPLELAQEYRSYLFTPDK